MTNYVVFFVMLGICQFGYCLKRNLVVPGEYVVVLKTMEGVAASKPGIAKLDIAKTLHSGRIGDRGYLHVRATNEEYKLLQKSGMVESVEPNYVLSLIRPLKPSPFHPDPQTQVNARSTKHQTDTCMEQTANPDIWGLIRTSYNSQPDYSTDGYKYDFEGDDVDIYIIDTGIDVAHEEFVSVGSGTSRATHSFVSSELEEEGISDLHGHGTHVASLAGGNRYGIAKKPNLHAVKVLDEYGYGSYAGIVSGIEYVRDKVRAQKNSSKKSRVIINMSLGGTETYQAMEDMIQDAIDEGIIVVVAAGNYAIDASMEFPAGYNNTITVGATDINDAMAYFSNYGPLVDILAPGDEVTGASSPQNYMCTTCNNPEHKCYLKMSGTSMSSPYVAGMVARYLGSLSEEEMENTNQETVRELLMTWATKDAIDLDPWQAETPNCLLHKGCN